MIGGRVAAAGAAILVVGVLLAGEVRGEDPPEGSSRPASTADVDLIREVREIATRAEGVIGRTLGPTPLAMRADPLPSSSLASARLERMIPGARLAARGRSWRSIGLGTAESPRSLYVALLEDLDGFFRDVEGRRLLVRSDRLASTDFAAEAGQSEEGMSMLLATGVRPDEPAVVHLLAHGDRDAVNPEARAPTTDALLAEAAWREGEGNVIAALHLFRGLALQEAVWRGAIDPSKILGGRLLPHGLGSRPPLERALLEFAYLEGFAQVRETVSKGGWAALDRAAGSRRTSRDVLHPDLQPLPAAGPSSPPPPDGYQVVDEDSIGEIGIVTLVSLTTGKDDLGLQSADGWAGDQLVRYETSSGEGFTLWETRWRTEARAKDFEYGFNRSIQGRYEGASLSPPDAEGWRVVSVGDAVIRVRREREGVRVRISPPTVDAKLQAGASRSKTPEKKSSK